MSASLGGLIKDYRLQKGIPQLEIALRLGWKESSQLSRIEQGKITQPSRELIDNICSIIGLNRKEKNSLLLAGGYIPTHEEIYRIRKELKDEIESWPYPVTIFDFAWRIIGENKISKTIYYENDRQAEAMTKDFPNMFEINFNPKYSQNKFANTERKKKIIEEQRQAIAQYKYDLNLSNIKKINRKILSKLMKNELFRELWTSVDPIESPEVMTNYLLADYVIPARDPNGKIVLSFHLFAIPTFHDPRIIMEMHVPSNGETIEYFKKINENNP